MGTAEVWVWFAITCFPLRSDCGDLRQGDGVFNTEFTCQANLTKSMSDARDTFTRLWVEAHGEDHPVPLMTITGWCSSRIGT